MDEAERARVLKVLDNFIEVREKHPWFVRDYLMDYADRVDYETRREIARREAYEEGIEEGRIEMARAIRAEGIMTNEKTAQVVGLPLEVIRSL